MAQVDFSVARQKHLEWRTRLRSFLDGQSTLTEDEAVSHKDCALGKWLYSEGLSQFGQMSEMQTLEGKHEEMHTLVRKVIQLGNAGDKQRAEEGYRKVERLSGEIVQHLSNIEFGINTRKSGIARLFDLTIRAKIIGYAVLVTLLLAALGLLGYRGVSVMNNSTDQIVHSSGLVDAAMEMKMAVGEDMTLLMDLLAAESEGEVADAWKAHEGAIATFDTFVDAILKGADTAEGHIGPAKDPALRDIVERADHFHNDEFQPRLLQIRDNRLEGLKQRQVQHEAMGRFEEGFDRIIGQAEAFEANVKERIEQRIAAGASAEDILSRENTWADMAMEMKTTISATRIAIEEYAQEMEGAEHEEIAKEYRKTLEEFDGWVGALLNGARNEEGVIARIDVGELRAMVEALDETHNEVMQEAAGTLMAAVDERARLEAIRGKLDEEADRIGGEMMELIGGVEEGAKKAMNQATTESKDAGDAIKTQMITGLIVGLLISALFGWLIVQAIARPLAQMLKTVGELAAGDLRNDIHITSGDEMGRLMEAMRNLVESLRAVVGQVREGAENIAAASAEISAGNSDLSQRTEEQASSLEETASSMEELTSTVKQNSDNARQANQLASGTRAEAEKSGEVVGEAIEAMQGINAASKKIAEIVGVVDEIAFQTNLLALNAAVEAARAGEQGRGFAVVASEVRKLAQRSADSAKEIKDLILDSVDRVEHGSALVDRSGKALEEIVSEVKKVSDIVAEIAAASGEQSSGIDQINKAVMQMDTVTQENAAMVEQIAANSKSLEEEAAGLRDVVSFFKV